MCIICCDCSDFTLDFVAGDLSGREGDTVMACIRVTAGSNQLIGDVNAVITPSDATTSGRTLDSTLENAKH